MIVTGRMIYPPYRSLSPFFLAHRALVVMVRLRPHFAADVRGRCLLLIRDVSLFGLRNTNRRAPRVPLGGAAMYSRSRFSYHTPVRVPISRLGNSHVPC